jgi:hypothetical protein
MTLSATNTQRTQINEKFKSPYNIKYLSFVSKKLYGDIFNMREEVNNYDIVSDINETEPWKDVISISLKNLNTDFIKFLGQKIVDASDSVTGGGDNEYLLNMGEIHTSSDTYESHIIGEWGPNIDDLEFMNGLGNAHINESKTVQKYPNAISKSKDSINTPLDLGFSAIDSLDAMHAKYEGSVKKIPEFVYF